MGKVTIQYLDFDGDKAQFSVNAGNGSAATYDADVAEVLALAGAIDGITIGTRVFHAWEAYRVESGAAAPNDPAAQANYQAVAVATDDVTGAVFNTRIPTPDHSLFTVITESGKATIDLSAGAGLALKTAWDALVLSPDGNASTLNQVYLRE